MTKFILQVHYSRKWNWPLTSSRREKSHNQFPGVRGVFATRTNGD